MTVPELRRHAKRFGYTLKPTGTTGSNLLQLTDHEASVLRLLLQIELDHELTRSQNPRYYSEIAGLKLKLDEL